MGARDDPDLAGEGGAVSTLPSRDRLVSRIVRSWRELSGGTSRVSAGLERRRLIACSAGGDPPQLERSASRGSAGCGCRWAGGALVGREGRG